MEARAGNSILDFETLFSDFQELLNGSGLKALSNGAIPKLNFLVSGRISVVMSTVFWLSYGRSGNKFCAEEGQNPIFDPLPRNEKLCGNL